MGATLPQLMNLRLDQIFLAAFLVPQSLGYYVAAVAWSSCIVPATSALGLVLFPRLGSADGERRLELVGTSEESIEDAITSAISRANSTLRNLRWFEVVRTSGHSSDGIVRHYQVTLKVGFTMEGAG